MKPPSSAASGERDRDAGDQWRAADPGPFLVGEVLLGRHGHLLGGGRQPDRGRPAMAWRPIRPRPGRTGSTQASANQWDLRQPWRRRWPVAPFLVTWFEHGGCWRPGCRWSGTARLYRGMSLAQTPPGLPLTRRLPW